MATTPAIDERPATDFDWLIRHVVNSCSEQPRPQQQVLTENVVVHAIKHFQFGPVGLNNRAYKLFPPYFPITLQFIATYNKNMKNVALLLT